MPAIGHFISIVGFGLYIFTWVLYGIGKNSSSPCSTQLNALFLEIGILSTIIPVFVIAFQLSTAMERKHAQVATGLAVLALLVIVLIKQIQQIEYILTSHPECSGAYWTACRAYGIINLTMLCIIGLAILASIGGKSDYLNISKANLA